MSLVLIIVVVFSATLSGVALAGMGAAATLKFILDGGSHKDPEEVENDTDET